MFVFYKFFNRFQVGEAWVGHPYYELIDNSTEFEAKMRRLTKVKKSLKTRLK